MSPAIHVMAKPTGAACNLDCTYCYYVHKETVTPSDWRMSDSVAEAYVRDYLAVNTAPEVTFAWQGGEPTLMGLPFFRRVLAMQAHYRAPGQRVANALQTNGTLLDEEWCRFLRENDFLVGVSLDGPEDIHDRYRVDRGGRPTFARVMAGIELLRRHGVEFNLLCTVNQANGGAGDRVYRFLRSQAMHLQFIPVIERRGDPDPSWPDGEVAPWSIGSQAYGTFLNAVFDAWFREDVGNVYVQLFEIQIAIALGLPASLCIFMETCGDALVLERDGGLYSCDHYVYPAFRLGDIREAPLAEMVTSPRQRSFGTAKRDALSRTCLACPDLRRCQGECPKHRFATTTDGEPISYLCAGYRTFFAHCTSRIDALAAGLRRGVPAPQTAAIWGPGHRARRSGPNEPCSCGSGRKTKRCCGAAR